MKNTRHKKQSKRYPDNRPGTTLIKSFILLLQIRHCIFWQKKKTTGDDKIKLSCGNQNHQNTVGVGLGR